MKYSLRSLMIVAILAPPLLAVSLILLPVLYVLGIGPAFALSSNWPVTSDLV